MRASAHMWLKRAAPPSGKLGSTPAGAPPWAPPQAVAQGLPDPVRHFTALEFSEFELLLNSIHQSI